MTDTSTIRMFDVPCVPICSRRTLEIWFGSEVKKSRGTTVAGYGAGNDPPFGFKRRFRVKNHSLD
jgi:hypothetical protein